jgi:pyruvate/2-oxoglutarate dehydrogenase complex dihydrolipoamide dehydrogenase (E3) component
MNDEHDVIVIGLGVGGEELGGSLARAGMDVLGIEARLVGGECPYWGCIPSKIGVRAAIAVAEAGRVNRLAGSSSVELDYAPVARRISDATAGWDDEAAVKRFQDAGGNFLRGRGRISGPGRVEVDGETFSASRAIVVAAGGAPAVPPIEGLSEVDFWTNREAMEAKSLPETMVVLGGGPIGLELAQAFHRLGTQVTIVEAMDRLLAPEEPENSDAIAAVIKDDAISVHTGVSAERVEKSADGTAVTLSDGTRLVAEKLLVAVGRRYDLDGLGVAQVGLPTDTGHIETDERLQAGDGLWAIGDITGKGAFTHLAMYQARIATAAILGRDHEPADYRAVPRVTFTDPEVASVGLTEEQARQQGIPVLSGRFAIRAVGKALVESDDRGLVKIVADVRSGEVLGGHIAAPAAGEMIHVLVAAMTARATMGGLAEAIYAFPTFAQGVRGAAREWLTARQGLQPAG